MSPLFPRRKQKRHPLVIQRLEVENLHWSLEEGSIGYRFRLWAESTDRLLIAVNHKLEFSSASGASKTSTRVVVEKDYGWARLKLLVAQKPRDYVEAYVSGVPEDFTLSRLGVRFGRALLRDELLWHPVLGDRLATWGTRGHIASYYVHVTQRDAVGPCVPQEVEDGLVFSNTPRLRSPGLTFIGGLRVEATGDTVVATLPGHDTVLARRILEWANDVATGIGEALNVKTPKYSVAALVWNDVEPFASDELIALRHGIAAPLMHGNSDALHEATHLISVHTVYNNSLGDLNDYWLYEVLPHVLALYTLSRIAPNALDGALNTLKKCLAITGDPKSLPGPATITVPRSQKHHVTLSCKAPLVFWHIAEVKGAEQLASLLSCVLSSSIGMERLRECLIEILGDQANDYVKRYLYGRAMPGLD